MDAQFEALSIDSVTYCIRLVVLVSAAYVRTDVVRNYLTDQ